MRSDSSNAGAGEPVRAFLERHERALVFAILLLGVVVRLVWVSQDGRLKPFIHEMQRVAVAFATTGVLADAYYPGQGPTAHVGPVMPLLGGFVYRAFGVGSLTSELLLTLLALTFLCITLTALNAAFRRLGAPVAGRLVAMAVIALVPLNFKFEVQSLRLFEGAFAAALLACNLSLVLRLYAKPALTTRDFIAPALLGALLALVNPPAALGAYGATGLLMLTHLKPARWLPVGAVMVVAIAALLGPWAVRNESVFGRLILTRSNYPLEHAIGFHPAAVAPQDPAAVFVTRIRSIHPYSGEPVSAARSEVIRIGELAYMDKLAAETKAWERANPGAATALGARHGLEYWLPPRWMWRIYDPNADLVPLRQAYVWGVTLAAFAAVAWGMFRTPLVPWLFVACTLIAPSLPYFLVQPVQRYRYLVYALTVFLAMEFATRLWQVVAVRRSAVNASP